MKNFTGWGCMVALLGVLLLGACSGGTSGAAAPASTTLSGTAAVGFPIVGGAVNVTCAAGTALTGIPNTSATGAWSVNVSGQTLPCAVRVTGGTINSVANIINYQSIAISLGTVNVTPLTDLIVANLAGANPSTWFTGLTPTQVAAITDAQVTTALTNLRTALNLTALNTINPITLAFNPTGGVAMDDILTALRNAITSSATTYAALLNAAGLTAGATITPPAGLSTALATAYAATTSGGTPPPPVGGGSGTTSGAITAPLNLTMDGHYMLTYSAVGSSVGSDIGDIGIDFRSGFPLRKTLDGTTGGLIGYDTTKDLTTAANTRENVLIGTNSIAELGGDANITWGRWNGGTASGNYYASNANWSFANNQGFHYVLGVATLEPTSGIKTYNLSGSTQPTQGSGALGTFTGTMKVDYATHKVGIECTVTMPDRTYTVSSNGGLTTLTNSELTLTPNDPNFDVGFNNGADTIFGSIPMPQGGSACPNANGCNFTFDGMVVGTNGARVGGTYMIWTSSPGAGSVHGAAVFTAP